MENSNHIQGLSVSFPEMKMISTKTIVFILLITSWGFSQQQECDILDRVVVTGASVTSGFGLITPPIKGDLGGYPITLKHIMEGLIATPHKDVELLSNMMFFRNPKIHGDAFINQIIEYKPTLVIGIDFLFWFAYGSTGLSEPVEYRTEKFEYGLELLSKLDVPILVGDLPDMRKAIGKMLSARHVPSEETLKQLNIRLSVWAEEHDNVTVIPVHDLIESLHNDEDITVLDSTWSSGSQEKLLQDDMLHTTLEGTVIASLMIAELLQLDCVESNPKVIMKNAAAKAREDAKKN